MKTLISLLSFFTIALLTIPQTGSASPLPLLNSQDKEQQKTVREEDIKNLIQTLESESARKDLVTNLQLLLDQQSEKKPDTVEDIIPALTEQIGIRGQISRWIKQYERFLDKNAISLSLFHQSLGTIITLIVGTGLYLGVRRIAMRLILGLDTLSEKVGFRLTRIAFYARTIQILLKIFIVGLMAYTLAKIWDMGGVVRLFEGAEMRSFLTTTSTVLIVAILAAFIWETVGIYLSYILKQADDNNQTRIKTLLPLIRNIVLSVFGLLFSLVIMSELGLNVAPFLAGAGVIGVAIGFGAQNMFKDFITGFTIVLEDIIRVGDVVTLGGCNGVVEKITLRKVQLRDFAGIVYTVPFSQITTIQNMTKNFSFYAMEIGVSYKENTDRVIDVMREVDDILRNDQKFGHLILAPIDIVGVERFDENAVIIKARIKTQPVKQWDIGREYNRRLKIAFDVHGIEIPFAQRVITIKHEDTTEDKKHAPS